MKAWWDNLSIRERTLVAGGTALTLLLVFYLLVWEPLQASSNRLRQTIVDQRTDLAWMQQAAQEVKRLDNLTGVQADDGRSLLTLVDQTARTAGLGNALKRIAPQGEEQLSAQLDSVEFDKLIPWLGTLEQDYRITIISFSVDRTETAGLVNARIVLGGRP